MTKKPTKNPPSPMTKNIVHRKPWKHKRKSKPLVAADPPPLRTHPPSSTQSPTRSYQQPAGLNNTQ